MSQKQGLKSNGRAKRLRPTLLSRVWRNISGRRFRSYLVDGHKIEPAFTLDGVDYYCYANLDTAPAGRSFAALAIYNEMDMRCDRTFLEDVTKAIDIILSDPKKINIGLLAQINYNLKDRLNLMIVPHFIFKLASVIYFDKTESPYMYDFEYNDMKIERWKQNPKALDFFLQTPLTTLVPCLNAQKDVSSMFSQMAEQVEKIHTDFLTGILSGKT